MELQHGTSTVDWGSQDDPVWEEAAVNLASLHLLVCVCLPAPLLPS